MDKNDVFDESVLELEPQRKENKKWELTKKIVRILLIIGAAVVIAFYLQFSYRYSAYVVEGPSMQPTYNEFSIDGHDDKYDQVYVNLRGSYKLFDVIVFEYNNKKLIKRLIAQEGDEVNIVGVGQQTGSSNGVPTFKRYQVVVKRSGQSEFVALDESAYVAEENLDMQNEFKQFIEYKKRLYPSYSGMQIYNMSVVIGQDQIFALGDNRENSSDCSDFGPINKNAVLGRVDFVVKYNKTVLQKLWQKFRIRFIIK